MTGPEALLEALGPGSMVVRVTSHRARGRMKAILGYPPLRSCFSWEHPGEFYVLSPSNAALALTVTGVRRARVRASALHWCLS